MYLYTDGVLCYLCGGLQKTLKVRFLDFLSGAGAKIGPNHALFPEKRACTKF